MQLAPHLKWWNEARFGMFIHWGLYSMRATRKWITDAEREAEEGYAAFYKEKYFGRWNPDLYDPKAWARAAKEAGMKYFVITTKHHEGFCLWDTAHTAYNVANTPHGKDLIGPMVEAFREEGLRVGFYYSILDWHHPEFPIEGTKEMAHPQVNDEAFRETAKGRELGKYAEFVKDQLRELLTSYGQIDILWFDFQLPEDEDQKYAREIVELIRDLQPDIILNDRLTWHEVEGDSDLATPECIIPFRWVERDGKRIPWETCMTSSGFWGHYTEDHDWKSPDQMLRAMIDVVSKGGNFLMNVGPTGRGEFPSRVMTMLSEVGDWMKHNGRSIYGCTQAPPEFKAPPDCRLTYNPGTGRLYVHLFAWPIQELHIEGLAGKVTYAQWLHDAAEVSLTSPTPWHSIWEEVPEDLLTLGLPTEQPDVLIPVIELYFD